MQLNETAAGSDQAGVTYETYETQETYGNKKKKNEPHRNQGVNAQKSTTNETQPMSIREYLASAVGMAQRDYAERRAAGRWSTPCFWLVRQLKAHPELGPMTAIKVIAEIETIIHQWEHSSKWPEGFWQSFFFVHRHAAHAEFLDIWDRIKRLPGYDALENAVTFSLHHPLSLSQEILEKRNSNPKYIEFVSLCAWLQLTIHPEPIAIPCRKFANVLDIDAMTISRFRKWAVEDGLMVPFGKHEFHGVGSRNNKGSTFYFRSDLWPTLRDRGAVPPPHLNA